jgi:hypothetical protein
MIFLCWFYILLLCYSYWCHFYSILNLEVGRQYNIAWFLSPVDWGRDPWDMRSSPRLSLSSLPHTALEGKNSKNSCFGIVERRWSIFGRCFKLTRGCRPYFLGILHLSYCCLWGLEQWCSLAKSLSSPIKIAHGHPFYLWKLKALSCHGLAPRGLNFRRDKSN